MWSISTIQQMNDDRAEYLSKKKTPNYKKTPRILNPDDFDLPDDDFLLLARFLGSFNPPGWVEIENDDFPLTLYWPYKGYILKTAIRELTKKDYKLSEVGFSAEISGQFAITIRAWKKDKNYSHPRISDKWQNYWD